MGLLHDQIAERVALNFIQTKTFGNRYLASKLPIFPKPDIVLLGLSKDPMPQIAFEVKPPHAVKREYLTGLGQSTSYLLTFPLVYIVLPNEIIDGLHIPTFISDIVNKSDLKIGVISYDIFDFSPNIIREAQKQEEIDVNRLEKKINKSNPRSWLFWMDTNIKEIAAMLVKIDELENRKIEGDLQKIVLNDLWHETLSLRYTGSSKPSSYKLNYKLLFDTLNLWTGDGKLTVLGNRLYEISKKYGYDSREFKDALHYVILTEGGYLRMLVHIDKIQNLSDFIRKGTASRLNKKIREIRETLKLNLDVINEKDDVLPIYEKSGENSWLKVISIELFKMGYGRTLTQMNEELSRRFGFYFQKQLQTNFYLSKFIRGKGYAFNWEKIIDLIEKGEKNLDIF